MRIALSDEARSLASVLAGFRRRSNRVAGVVDRQIGNSDPFDIDYVGVLAELAFARCFNLWPDLACNPRAGGQDFDMPIGTIDVKATRHPSGNLLVPLRKDSSSDFFVLARVSDTAVDLVGFAPASDVMHESRVKDIGFGPQFFFPAGELTDIRQLGEIYER